MNSKKSITLLLCFILISSLGNMVSFQNGSVQFSEVRAAPDYIVDDGDAGFDTTGSAGWTSVAGPPGNSGDYSFDTDGAANSPDIAKWTPTLGSAGKYNVYLHWVANSNRATNAKYTVHYDSGDYTLYINQKLLADQITAGANVDSGWFFVGTFNFAASGGYVKLEDTNSDGYVIADAVKFAKLDSVEIPGFFIDEDDTGFTKTGTWTFDVGYGGIANDRAYDTAGTAGDSATWTPIIPMTGSYKVYLHWTTASNRATSAKYTITHASGTATKLIDQTKLADQTTVGTPEQFSGWYDAGTYTFNAGSLGNVKLDDSNSTAGQYIIADGVKFVYVPGAAHHFAVTINTDPVQAGVAFTVTVEALDSNNYRVIGYGGLVTFTSSDINAELPAAPAPLASGIATIGGFKFKTMGTQSVTARDSITPSITGTDSATVTPGPLHHFTITAPASAANCPTTFNVTAKAVDEFENIVTSYVPAGALTVGSNPADAGAIYGTPSFTNGQATFTACKTIDGKITLTDTAISGESNTIDINPTSGGVDHFFVNSLTDPVTAGTSFSVHVEARDYLDNVLTTYSGLVEFLSTDSQAVLPGSTSLTNGVGDIAGFTLKTAGTQTITARDSVYTSVTGSDTITVNHDVHAGFIITAPENAFLCPTAFTVSASAVDAYGNTITTYAGTPTIGHSPADAGAIFPATATFVTGTSNFSGCKTVDGQITLTDGAITGSSNFINTTVTNEGIISGIVYWDDPNGILDAWEQRLAGAYIFLDNKYVTQSLLDGSYSIPNVLAGNHWVTVRLPGYQVQTKNIATGGVIGDPVVNFGLLPFDSIIGRVTKPDGTGVVGVHVFAYRFGERPNNADPLLANNYIAEGLTDVFGNYVIQTLPPGNYDLLTYRREYIQQWKYNVVVDSRSYNVGGTQVKFNWHQTKAIDFMNYNYRYATLSGFVWGGGIPLGGVTVKIPGLGLSATTDSYGAYQIDNIPMGWYYVTAEKSGYNIGVQFVSIGDYECNVHPIQNFNLTQLGQLPCCSGTIQGRVTDGVQGLENALVEIPGLGWTEGTGMELYTDKTGYFIFTNYPGPGVPPNGYVAHPIPAGANNKYYIVVHHQYVNPLNPDNESDDIHKVKAMLVVVLPDKITDADFLLDENPGLMKGRIINTDGIPVEGATVMVPNSPYTTVTDSFGAYVLRLPAEKYSEGCRFPPADPLCEEYQRGIREIVPTAHEDQQSANPHGMKLAHYWVVVQKAGYKDEWMKIFPTPGGTNIFLFEGEQQYEPLSECVNCWNSTVLTYETGILKGSVYDSKGTSSTGDDVPLIDSVVTAAGRDINLNTWISNLYEFTEVPVGSYHIVVSGLGPGTLYGVEYNVSVSADQITVKDMRVDVAHPPVGVIAGIVYSNRVKRGEGVYLGDTVFDVPIDIIGSGAGATFEPGEGVAGVKVTPTITTSATNNSTDSYGFYVIKSLPTSPNMTTIVAEKSGWTTAANPAVSIGSRIYLSYPGPPGISGARGGAGVSTFPMVRLVGSLSGRVTNTDNRDITGAITTIFIPQSEDGLDNTVDETDTNGFYMFQAVEYGTYLIEVCGGGGCGIGYETTFSLNTAGQGEPVAVSGNATRDLTMIKKVARVEGFVEDTYGNILVDAEVKISGKYIATSDCMGYYTILNVPQCSHTAIASKPGFKIRMWNNIYASIGPVEGEVFTADFTDGNGLEPLVVPIDTGTVEGFVDLELTDGLCGMEVDLNPTGQSTYTDCEGWWIILEVQPSSGFTYVVHFRLSGYDNAYVEGIAVAAGGSTVVDPVRIKRTACTVTGVVTDQFTGLPVVGAIVKISDMYRTTLETNFGRTLSNYTATTDSNGRYTFVSVPWSDAQIADLNKTFAWTVYVIKDNYYVQTLNVIVDQNCANTSDKNLVLRSMWGSISGAINWDGCTASSATITATAFVSGSGTGTATVTTGVAPYKIYPLKPGAYTVSASAGSCTVTPTSYTGATAIPVNAGLDTPNTNFTLGTGTGGTPPAAPTIVAPTCASTVATTTPTLDWSDVATATSYDVEVYTNSGYTGSPIASQTGLASSQWTVTPALNNGVTYYWRVLARNSYGPSSWTTCSFTVNTSSGTVPSIPNLLSPSNGQTNVCPLTGLAFDWSDSTGTIPITYQIQLSTSSAFTTTVFDQLGINTSNYTYSGTLSASTLYYWRVRATNSLGTSDWSTVWPFTTGTCTSGLTPPTLISPSNGYANICGSFNFTWNPATGGTGAITYRIQVDNNSDFSSPVIDQPTSNTFYPSGVPSPLAYSTTFYWRVSATDSLTTLWSSSWYFTTGSSTYCAGGGEPHEPPDRPDRPNPISRPSGPVAAKIEYSFTVTAESSMQVSKGKGEQSVVVKNTGAWTQYFEMKAQAPDGFKYSFSTEKFSLGPTTSKEVGLSIIPPANAEEGLYDIKVIVTSDGGDKKTVKLSMEIYYTKLSLSELAYLPNAPEPKEDMKISAKVTNGGSKDEKVDVVLSIDGKQVGKKNILVQKGSNVTVFFGWNASGGSHKIVMQMSSERLTKDLLVANPLRAQAESLYDKAKGFFEAGNYEASLETFREAQALFEKLGESRDIDAYITKAENHMEADTLFDKAQEYLKSGDYAKAQEYFAQAEKAYSDAGDIAGVNASREGMTKSQSTKSESNNAAYAKVAALFIIAAIGAASSAAFYLKSRKLKRKENGIPKIIKP